MRVTLYPIGRLLQHLEEFLPQHVYILYGRIVVVKYHRLGLVSVQRVAV